MMLSHPPMSLSFANHVEMVDGFQIIEGSSKLHAAKLLFWPQIWPMFFRLFKGQGFSKMTQEQSMLAHNFGAYMAFKRPQEPGSYQRYYLIPKPAQRGRKLGPVSDQSKLYREDLKKYFAENKEARFDFCVQVQKGVYVPDDISTVWDTKIAPLQKVGELVIPTQEPEPKFEGRLFFRPNSMPFEYGPMGSIAAARGKMYAFSQEFRGLQKWNIDLTESDFDVPSASSAQESKGEASDNKESAVAIDSGAGVSSGSSSSSSSSSSTSPSSPSKSDDAALLTTQPDSSTS